MSTFKKGNKYHNYFVEKDKMMLSKDPPWKIDGGDGKGDALWRTSLAYMTWKLPDMKEGILGCFRKFDMIGLDKYWYQASRYTGRYKEDDVSRDQTLLAFSALKVNGDQEELNEILNHLEKNKIKVPIGLNVEHIMSYNFQASIEMLQELSRIYREFCIKTTIY